MLRYFGLDGTEGDLVYKYDVTEMVVSGSYIVMHTPERGLLVDDGTQLTKISDDIYTNLSILGNWVYGSRDGQIYRIPLTGGEAQLISE